MQRRYFAGKGEVYLKIRFLSGSGQAVEKVQQFQYEHAYFEKQP